MNTFENFNLGQIIINNAKKSAENIEWCKHPTFKGVELKHLITSEETNGQFSYHWYALNLIAVLNYIFMIHNWKLTK